MNHDLECVFILRNAGASGGAGSSNGGWLRADVAAGIPHEPFNRTTLQFTMLHKDLFRENNITLLDHPACSPDLNPIEIY